MYIISSIFSLEEGAVSDIAEQLSNADGAAKTAEEARLSGAKVDSIRTAKSLVNEKNYTCTSNGVVDLYVEKDSE